MPLNVTAWLVVLALSLTACRLFGQTSQPQPTQDPPPASQPPPASPAGQPAPTSQRAPLDEMSLKAVEVFDQCEGEIGAYGYTQYDDSTGLAWGGAYINMGYLGMYEGTGDQRYLDTLLERIKRTLAMRGDRLGLRDDQRDKVMPCWINQVHTGQPRIAEVSPTSCTDSAPAAERQASSAPKRPTSSEPKASSRAILRGARLWVKKSTLTSPLARWQ